MNRLLLLAPRIATNRLWARAGEVPSFHIAPARTQNARDLITGSVLGTYNSASPALAVGPDGVLYQPTPNAPVIEYDAATLACLGARICWVLTNEVRNSNNYSAVVTGSPGTLPTNWSAQGNSNGWTRTVVGTGTVGALGYVDIRFNGTPTGSQFATIFQPQGVVAASNGQSWTASIFHQLVAGSLGNVIGYPAANLWNSSNSFLGGLNISGSIIPSTTMQRFGGGATINQANTAFISWGITFICTAGSTYDFTIRFAGPQLQTGSILGPYVPTTTLAASSTADVWDITSPTAGINNLKTIYFRGRTSASGTRGIASLNDNSSSNRLELSTSGTDPKATAVTSGSTVADLNGGTIAANTTFRLAVRFDTDSYALSLNGGAVTTDTSGARALVDRLFIGRDQAGNYQNGYLEEFAGWTKACTDAQLSALAAS